jgi:hypothetical protein
MHFGTIGELDFEKANLTKESLRFSGIAQLRLN